VFQLNDRSRVRVNLTDSTRYVWVDSGEVFFDVSPDAQRPFDVQVGTTRLIAKGTAFSVRKDDTGEVETTVRHGLVEVQVPRLYRGAPEQTGDTRKAAATRAVGEIKAGEVGTIDADGQFSVTQVEEADIARRLAWADPVRSLNGMTLNQAVALFNRYNARKLEIADPELGRMPVSGLYHLTQPEQFIERLGQLGIRHVIQGSEASAGARIILMRK
jgi:transmembrane sensor